MPNIETILQEHTTMQVECIDRIYLHGYVPGLQRPNQLAWFLKEHMGKPVASPALLGQLTERFVAAIIAFAKRNSIPIVRFSRGERKDDVAKKHLAHFRRSGRTEGVIFIGVAQENVSAFRSSLRRRPDGSVASFEFYRGQVCVNHYYFYVLDREWGPAFIKFCSYVPFGIRVCLNGHEWVKCQLRKSGIPFEALDNGFLSCPDSYSLQEICDRLDAEHVAGFCRKWLARLPHPFSRQDQAAGYIYQFSIWQMEFSLTHVFDRPLSGRHFFEEVIRDNLDLGRPRATPGSFRTRIVQHGVLPKLSVEYKHSRLKQYFKEGRALRTETTINDPYDVGVGRGLGNLPALRIVARDINRRLIETQRASHNCAIAPRTFESLVLPSDSDGQHAPALRFGDPRVMAVLASLCFYLPSHDGLSNPMLRERVAALLDASPNSYTAARMTYDLRRLRLKGIIERLPRRNRYRLTPLGLRVALFFTKAFARVLRPGLARIDPKLPPNASDFLADAWLRVDKAVDAIIREARLAA